MVVGLLAVGFGLRVLGYDFDQGLLLHPDELFIVEKVTALGCCLGGGSTTWPNPFAHFLDARLAPYNPHFFNYGSMPVYLLAAVTRVASAIGATVPALASWRTSTGIIQTSWIGRWISALFDTGSLALVFLIGRHAFDRRVGLLAMAFATFTVLAIQLSHFYAVDTILTFFVLLSLLGAIKASQEGGRSALVLAGAGLGAALAVKASAFPLVLPIFAAPFLFTWSGRSVSTAAPAGKSIRAVNRALGGVVISLAVAALTFAILEPYGLIDHRQLFADVQLQSGIINTHSIPAPYTIQFTGTQPYLYYLKNMFFWYLGPALAIAAGCGLIRLSFLAIRRRTSGPQTILLLWVIPYGVVIGGFWAKFGRYTLPLLGVLCILGAAFLLSVQQSARGWWRAVVRVASAAALVATAGWALAFMNVYASINPQIQASRWIYSHLTPTTPFATEGEWDRSLPFCPPTESCRPYFPFQLNLFSADDAAKVDRLVYALTHDRFIVMSTQRFVDSIPKVPKQYPITANYYRLLFNNRLNFRLVKRFALHPRLGPWVIDDFPADENFTVFDHPDVRIFKRIGPISAARARHLLITPSLQGSPPPEWDGLPPASARLAAPTFQHRAATPRPARSRPSPALPPTDAGGGKQDRRLMLDGRQWAEDQTAPTYDQMFPPRGAGASHPILLWLALVELLGLIAFPLTFFALRGLVDRGWVVAKTAGVILFAWLIWAVVGLGGARYSFRTIWTVTAVLAVAAAVGWVIQRRRLWAYLRATWRQVAITEAVFLAGFLAFVLLRMWYPDLGHQFAPVSPTNIGQGRMGEKQLELAFVNAISRSQTFPPLDPFFAGGYINYYYFGYVMVSALCKATTIPPAMGFNLAVAMFFGLLLATSYSVGRSLTRSAFFGAVTALFVAVVGNLNGLIQAVQDVQSAATLTWTVPFLGGIVEFGSGFVQAVFLHRPIPAFDFWASSRIVPPVGVDFAEFPYWTYLFGDLHAQLMAFPIDMAVIALSVSLAIDAPRRLAGRTSRWAGRRALAGSVLLGGILLGAAEATNPLDTPTYGLVLGAGACLGVWRAGGRGQRSSAARVFPLGGKLARTVMVGGGLALASVALGIGLFPPIIQGYHPVFDSGLATVVSAAGSVGRNLAGPPAFLQGTALRQGIHDSIVTPLPVYWESFGLFLLVTVAWVAWLWLAGPRRAPEGRRLKGRAGAPMVSSILAVAVGAVAFVLLDLWMLAFLVVTATLLLAALARRGRVTTRVVWISSTLLLALGLSGFTETAYVRDYLNGGPAFRMNTVAKLYNQIWLLFALGAAGAAAMMFKGRRMARGSSELMAVNGGPWRHAPLSGDVATVPDGRRNHFGSRGRRRTGWFVFVVALAFTIGVSLIFTYAGTVSRENYRQTWLPETSVPLTLDGMAFMKVAYPDDYAGISWLNAHVRGTPIVLEADQAYYNWRSRVAQFTGLPTLYGGIYEGAQRYPDEVAGRQAALEEIYGATTASVGPATPPAFQLAACAAIRPLACLTLGLLRAFHVSYIYVGLMERQLWPAGVGKFARLSGITRVFHSGGVTIYHVDGSPA